MTSALPVRAVLLMLLLGAAWAGWLGLRHVEGRSGDLLERLENTAADLRISGLGPRPAPGDPIIVAIDDATVAAEGGYPLDRSRLAALIERIAAAGARAVAVDLLLVDAGTPVADAALAQALAALPSVIAAAAVFDPATPPTPGVLPMAHEVLAPLPPFAENARVGLVNITADAGGTPRQVPMAVATRAGPLPSLALRAVEAAAGAPAVLGMDGLRLPGGKLRRLDHGWQLPLRPYGPRGRLTTVSAMDLLAPGAAEPDLRGRLVLVGATATGIGDRFSTAFDPVLPGVEVLATAVAHLLDGGGLIRDRQTRMLDAAVAVALALAGLLAVATAPPLAAVAISAGLVGLWLGVGVAALARGYWLAAALPVAAVFPPVAIAELIRQIAERRRARGHARAEAELSRFVAPALARRIAGDPDFLRQPRSLEAAVLFVDLAGFTGLAERLGPDASRALLKRFHTLVAESAAEHGGLVLDYMGDGAMLGFGLPEPSPDDAARALKTGFGLARAVAGIRAPGVATAGPLQLRVGGHLGPVILSRLGHHRQQQIAATGDSVNVASRLQEAARDLNAVAVISAALADAAGALPPGGSRRRLAIRGRSEELDVLVWAAASDPG